MSAVNCNEIKASFMLELNIRKIHVMGLWPYDREPPG